MDTVTYTKKSIHLLLSEEEPRWLKSYLQNAFCKPEEEGDSPRKMRKKFFNALKEALE